VDIPFRTEREFLALRATRKQLADLEAQARLMPGSGRTAPAASAAPTAAAKLTDADRKAERKQRRAKRKARKWKPSFPGAHRGY
jgi:hypothetical protein